MELKVRTSESALIRTAWWEFYLLYWKTNKQTKNTRKVYTAHGNLILKLTALFEKMKKYTQGDANSKKQHPSSAAVPLFALDRRARPFSPGAGPAPARWVRCGLGEGGQWRAWRRCGGAWCPPLAGTPPPSSSCTAQVLRLLRAGARGRVSLPVGKGGESRPLQRGSAGSVAAVSGGAAARHGGAKRKEIRLRVPHASRL